MAQQATKQTGSQSIKNTTKPGDKYDKNGNPIKDYSDVGVQVINNGTLIDKPMVKQISADQMETIGNERKMLQFTVGETYYLVKSYKVLKKKDGTPVEDPFAVGIYKPRMNYPTVL